MAESAIEVIRCYQNKPGQKGERWTVLPPVPEEEIAAAEAKWRERGRVYPEKYKELQRFTAGLEHDSWPGKIEFNVGYVESDVFGLFPRSIEVTHDGGGNSWVVDTALDPTRLGPVFFVCHDPAVLIYQSRDLAAFLDMMLNKKDEVWIAAGTDSKIWSAGESGGRVQSDWIVYDLQSEVIGSGAPICLYYDDPVGLERIGNSLVFRIKKRERNWWQRFRDKWR